MCSSLCRIQLNSCALAGLLLPPPLERQLVGMGPEINKPSEVRVGPSMRTTTRSTRRTGSSRATIQSNPAKEPEVAGLGCCVWSFGNLQIPSWREGCCHRCCNGPWQQCIDRGYLQSLRGDGSAENVVWEAKCLTGIATNLRIPSSRGRIVVEWPPQYR